jgi:hypothetical protein
VPFVATIPFSVLISEGSTFLKKENAASVSRIISMGLITSRNALRGDMLTILDCSPIRCKLESLRIHESIQEALVSGNELVQLNRHAIAGDVLGWPISLRRSECGEDNILDELQEDD